MLFADAAPSKEKIMRVPVWDIELSRLSCQAFFDCLHNLVDSCGPLT